MGKRNNQQKPKQKPLPTSECAVCSELRRHWKGQIKTIDRQMAVEKQIQQLTSAGELNHQGRQGQYTLYQCPQCHRQWQYLFLDNCVPGVFSD